MGMQTGKPQKKRLRGRNIVAVVKGLAEQIIPGLSSEWDIIRFSIGSSSRHQTLVATVLCACSTWATPFVSKPSRGKLSL